VAETQAKIISSEQIIATVGKAMGKQAKAFNAQLDELRQSISPAITIERNLGIVRRGLDALMLELLEDGDDCSTYCQKHYGNPLGDALSEYYFSTGLAFAVPLALPDGTPLEAVKRAQRFDRMRYLLLSETERIVGQPIVKGRMIKGHIDVSRVAALHKNDPTAILETSSCHLFLIAKAERLRAFADGLRDHPLGDPRTLRFRSLLEESVALGANSDTIRRLETRMKEVVAALDDGANAWETASVQYGRDWYRMVHAAHLGKTDDPLPPPSSIQDRYRDCAARYVAGEPFRLKYLGHLEVAHV
jgi:hypothetical protein